MYLRAGNQLGTKFPLPTALQHKNLLSFLGSEQGGREQAASTGDGRSKTQT